MNGNLKAAFQPGVLQVDQAVGVIYGPVVIVGTSEEDLLIGDIATLGYVFLRNLDAANFVTYGPKSGGSMIPFGRIKAGEIAMLRLEPGITWRWIADTGSVKVQVLLLNN